MLCGEIKVERAKHGGPSTRREHAKAVASFIRDPGWYWYHWLL